MFYYPKGRNRRDLRWRADELEKIVRSSVTHPFQKDYSEFIHAVLSETILEEHEKKYTIKIQNERHAKGGTLNAPNLTAYFFQCVFPIRYHGYADIAILEDNNTKSYIVLYGETIKRWLDCGVAGYNLPLRDSVKEVAGLIGQWSDYINSVKGRFDQNEKNWWRHVKNSIAKDMLPIGTNIRKVIETYIAPVFGEETIVPETVSDVLIKDKFSRTPEKEEPIRKLMNVLASRQAKLTL